MAEYKGIVDVVNIIGNAFGTEKGFSDITIEGQLKKRKPEFLEDIFFCVDTIHLITQDVHILVERQFAKGDHMIYKEIEENRDPKGILTKFSWKRKDLQIEVEAEYEPLTNNNELVGKAYHKINKYLREKKIFL